MADVPAFTKTPNAGPTLAGCRISTANTNRDGTGTLGTIFTAGADGGRIDRIKWKATSTTTAGVVRIFMKDTQGSPAIRLLFEALVTAITPSATVKSAEGEFVRSDGQPLVIVPAGWSVVAGTHNAESFDVIVDVGGDY